MNKIQALVARVIMMLIKIAFGFLLFTANAALALSEKEKNCRDMIAAFKDGDEFTAFRLAYGKQKELQACVEKRAIH